MLINVYWLLKCKLLVWGISMMFPEHKGRLYSGQAWQGATSEAMKQGASWVRPPQRQTTAGADTVRSAQEFTVTAETASPQVNVHKERAHTHTHTEIHMQTLAVNPALAHLPLTLMVRVKENVNLSSPSDLQNVLSLSYRTALSARCQINSHIIFSLKGENN